jgi:hypothetical protein
LADTISLDQMAALAAQMLPQDQLKLVARISGQLSASLAAVAEQASTDESARKQRLRLAEELLAEVEDIADDSQGQFDAVETVQQLRDGRTTQICPRGA